MTGFYDDRFRVLATAETDIREHLLDTRAITDLSRDQRAAIADQATHLAAAAEAYAKTLRLVIEPVSGAG